MAIDGIKVVDLDSHLVGDFESLGQTIEEKWKRKLLGENAIELLGLGL